MMAIGARLFIIVAIIRAFGLASSAFAIDPPHDTVSDCANCHTVHHASYPALLATLCESCHHEGGPARAVATHSSLTTDNGYGDWDVKCWGCHDPHTQRQDRAYGTTYGMFLRTNLNARIYIIDPNDPGPYYEPLSTDRTVTSSDVEHTSNTGFVDTDASASDDICQVCHVSTSYYNTGLDLGYHADYGAASQPGGTCTSCHPHTGGFAPAGGGSCVGCHASPQGTGGYRRQVTGSGGDFERLSHHVTDGTTTEIVLADDCAVCHDQTNHQSNAEPGVLLNDPDGGASHTYDGSGASIESFCLNCHDSDGSVAFDADGDSSDGYQPFSDGRDPPDIATAWVSSSHGTSLVPALANDGCLACHGGTDSTRSGLSADQAAHGSALPFLLSATVAGTTIPNAEEGLCFACHDGVTASTDIASEFAGTETFTDSSGALINPHHDVSDADQTYSGAVIECGDCHLGPHQVSSGSTLLADPDPTDGITPTAGTRWSGSTWQSEWCLDCHDGSYPPTVTPPTNPLIDVATSFSDTRGDQHGAKDASRNLSLRAGSGYARGDILECTVCHNPGHGDDDSGTVYPNLFNLRSIIYAADGVTPLTPDSSWDPANPNVVRLTNLDGANTDVNTNGQAWCSTCHPNPMGGNKDSGCLDGNCHHHNTGSF